MKESIVNSVAKVELKIFWYLQFIEIAMEVTVSRDSRLSLGCTMNISIWIIVLIIETEFQMEYNGFSSHCIENYPTIFGINQISG